MTPRTLKELDRMTVELYDFAAFADTLALQSCRHMALAVALHQSLALATALDEEARSGHLAG